jgi:hypothetical protein
MNLGGKIYIISVKKNGKNNKIKVADLNNKKTKVVTYLNRGKYDTNLKKSGAPESKKTDRRKG